MADNNNFWSTVGQSALGGLGGSLLGSIGSQLGYGLGELTGYNDKLRKEQLDQQKALTTLQYNSNYNLMKASYEQQYDMWNKTNYPAQIRQLQQAGLNPALLYAKGGPGGTTGSGGASVGGGQASDVASLRRSNTEQQMAGMAMMKLSSEVDLNKAQAEKLRAEAQTTTEQRPWQVEEMRQRGQNTWLHNLQEKYKMNPQEATTVYRHKLYGVGGVTQGGLFDQQLVSEITKANAEAGNADAQALLSNQKAMGYWKELANATQNADSQAIQAAAQKLASEFNYGEYTNWKYWAQLGSNVFKIIK